MPGAQRATPPGQKRGRDLYAPMRSTALTAPTTPTDFASGGFWSLDADRRSWSSPSRGAAPPLYRHDRDYHKAAAPLSTTAFYDPPSLGTKASLVQAVRTSERRHAAMCTSAADRPPLSKPAGYRAAPGSYSPLVATKDMSNGINELKSPTSAFASRGPRMWPPPSALATTSEIGYSSVAADRRAWGQKANGQRTGSAWGKEIRYPRPAGPGSNVKEGKLYPAPNRYQHVFHFPEQGWIGTARGLYPTT